MSVLTRVILLIALCLFVIAPCGLAAPSNFSNETSVAAPVEGQEVLPSRASVRCRWAKIKPKPHYWTKFAIYKIFVSEKGPLKHDNWCEFMEKAVIKNCGENGGRSNRKQKMKAKDVLWTRCDRDGKDIFWERGYVGTIKMKRWSKQSPECVTKVLEESLQGSVLDWIEQKGCYYATRSGEPPLDS